MKGLRRLFTVLFGVVLTALGALMLLCVNNQYIRSFWHEGIDKLLASYWAGTVVAACLVLLGIIAIAVGVHIKRSMPYAKVSMGDFGQVEISLAAVDTVVKRAAYSIAGIEEVKTKLKSDNTGISVLLDVAIDGNCNVPDTIALLQTDVKEQLERVVGIKVNEVRTAITSIANARSDGEKKYPAPPAPKQVQEPAAEAESYSEYLPLADE